MFSARHYRFLAAFLAGEYNRTGSLIVAAMVRRLAAELARDNPKFKLDVFIDYYMARIQPR